MHSERSPSAACDWLRDLRLRDRQGTPQQPASAAPAVAFAAPPRRHVINLESHADPEQYRQGNDICVTELEIRERTDFQRDQPGHNQRISVSNRSETRPIHSKMAIEIRASATPESDSCRPPLQHWSGYIKGSYSPMVRTTLLSGRLLLDESLSCCLTISSYFGSEPSSPFGTMCTTL